MSVRSRFRSQETWPPSLSSYLCYFSSQLCHDLIHPHLQQSRHPVGSDISIRKLLGDKFFRVFLNTNPRAQHICTIDTEYKIDNY